MKVVYDIPDFLVDKFTNMNEKEVCDFITKALAKDFSVTDRLCLDMRIDQVTYFQQVLSKLNDIGSVLQSGAIVSAGNLTATPVSTSFEVSEVKEEKYVSICEDIDDDLDEFGFGDFVT